MISHSPNYTRIGSDFAPAPGQLRVAVFAGSAGVSPASQIPGSAGVSPASGICDALVREGVHVRLFGSTGVSPELANEINGFDVVLKFSGCGDSDREIEEMLLDRCAGSASIIFVDADVPGNLRDISAHVGSGFPNPDRSRTAHVGSGFPNPDRPRTASVGSGFPNPDRSGFGNPEPTVVRLEPTVVRLESTVVRLESTVVRLDPTAVRLDPTADNPDHFRRALIPRFDAVLVTSGGPTACDAYESLGARRTGTLYPALGPNDCAPTFTDEDMECDVLFAGDREADTDNTVRELFFTTAAIRPDCRFILAGKGWDGMELPENVRYIGPLTAKNRAEAYSSARFVLSIAPESAKEYGFCPTAGLFEAASSGACVISDSWPGLGSFFKPDWEILVAHTARDMSIYLDAMYGHTAARLGNRAWERVMTDHTHEARTRDLLALAHELRASLVMA